MPKQETVPRCTATNTRGRRCGHRALRGSQLCGYHDDRLLSDNGKRRCEALTSSGRRCRKWAVGPAHADPDGDGRALCVTHAGLAAAPADDARSCTATRADGERCRARAVTGSEPFLCWAHRRGQVPAKGDEGRCRAMTAKGTRCRKWATRESREAGEGRCEKHGSDWWRPGVGKRRCTATTAKGRRCLNWTMPGTAPPPCRMHAEGARHRAPGPEDDAAGRVCTATTVSGRRCKKWATAGTKPPVCHNHAYPEANPSLRHGFYRHAPALTAVEAAAVARLAAEGAPLAAEIALLRLKIRRVLAWLGEPDRPTRQRLNDAQTALKGLRTVARLQEAQRALLQEEAGAEEAFTLDPLTGGGLAGQVAAVRERVARQEGEGTGKAASGPEEEKQDES